MMRHSRWSANLLLQQALQPDKPNMRDLIQKFPHLVSINLLRCQPLRNRHFTQLTSSELHIEQIQIGHSIEHSHPRPNLTNKVIHSASRQYIILFMWRVATCYRLTLYCQKLSKACGIF